MKCPKQAQYYRDGKQISGCLGLGAGGLGGTEGKQGVTVNVYRVFFFWATNMF